MKTAFVVKSILLILMAVKGLSAMAQMVAPQSGYYRLQVGAVEVIALSDSTVPVSAMELFHDALQPTLDPASAGKQSSPVRTIVNAVLFRYF